MMLSTQQILERFGEGFDCSQVVFGEFAEQIGLDAQTAKKIAACFGGGMWYGHECGAVTGALMVIGAKYGHCTPGDTQAKNTAIAKIQEFRSRFLERRNSCVCKELLGYDLSNPADMEKIQQEGLLTNLCPNIVHDALTILEEIL